MIGGLILVNKPVGLTSRYVTTKVMRALNYKKAGHTGTLDKMASGMLPICLGEATKFSSYITDSDKKYSLKALFGFKSNTGDMEGECIARSNKYIAEEELRVGIEHFKGEIEQIPPMYSAVKHEGRPLYKYARSGVELERKSRKVMIYDICLKNYAWPWFELQVHCSKGTYIRTLIDDIAEYFGTHAYLVGLRRDWVQGFSGNEMHSIQEILEFSSDISIISIKEMLPCLDCIEISATSSVKFLQGQKLLGYDFPDGTYKVLSGGKFLGLGDMCFGTLLPKRLVSMEYLN